MGRGWPRWLAGCLRCGAPCGATGREYRGRGLCSVCHAQAGDEGTLKIWQLEFLIAGSRRTPEQEAALRLCRQRGAEESAERTGIRWERYRAFCRCRAQPNKAEYAAIMGLYLELADEV